MPRLTHQTPKYRKHKASAQAFVELNGHRYYLGPYGTKASKREYDRLIAEWLTSGRSASFGVSVSETTIVELMAEYAKYAKDYYGVGPNSELHRIITALRPVRELYGRTPAIEFSVMHLKVVRQHFLDKDYSRTYINASIKRVVRLFRWAASEGRVPPSVPQALALVPGLRQGKTTARETKPVLPVDDAVVEQTLQHLPQVVADMVRLQRFTGMRPGEVCIVRPCDIDRSGEVWLYRPESHKTAYRGRERIIAVGPRSQSVLLRYLARDTQDYCFKPRDSEAKRRAEVHTNRKTPLSCGNVPGSNRKAKPKRSPGECYNSRSYCKAIGYACKKAFPHPELSQIKRAELTEDQSKELREWQSSNRWSPNQLRHTVATEVRREFGLEAAQVILGHSQAKVTQVYAERDLAKGLEVARKIG